MCVGRCPCVCVHIVVYGNKYDPLKDISFAADISIRQDDLFVLRKTFDKTNSYMHTYIAYST